MTHGTARSPRYALAVFLLAVAGSITGTLAGPRIVAAFDGAPAWLLPAVAVLSVALALLAALTALRLATTRERARHGDQR